MTVSDGEATELSVEATTGLYGLAMQGIVDRQLDWATANIKVMLLDSTYVFSQDAHRYKVQLTGEVSGTGYTAGGKAVTSRVLDYYFDPGNLTVEARLQCADISWPDVTLTGVKYAVFYNDTGDPNTSMLICCWQFSPAMAVQSHFPGLTLRVDSATDGGGVLVRIVMDANAALTGPVDPIDAPMLAKPYLQMSRLLASATFDWDMDSIKVMLLRSSYTPAPRDHRYLADVDDHEIYPESSGLAVVNKGYAAGGVPVEGRSVTYGRGAKAVYLSCNDVQWPNGSITARYAVFYKDTGSAATSPVLMYWDFVEDQVSGDGPFVLVVPDGIAMRLSTATATMEGSPDTATGFSRTQSDLVYDLYGAPLRLDGQFTAFGKHELGDFVGVSTGTDWRHGARPGIFGPYPNGEYTHHDVWAQVGIGGTFTPEWRARAQCLIEGVWELRNTVLGPVWSQVVDTAAVGSIQGSPYVTGFTTGEMPASPTAPRAESTGGHSIDLTPLANSDGTRSDAYRYARWTYSGFVTRRPITANTLALAVVGRMRLITDAGANVNLCNFIGAVGGDAFTTASATTGAALAIPRHKQLTSAWKSFTTITGTEAELRSYPNPPFLVAPA